MPEHSIHPPRMLDVGCGMRKRAGAIGIDRNPRSQADIIHDLNIFPYPFEDHSFDAIICDNVVEHLDDVLRVMEELHRIASRSATITVMVPFYAHRNAATDPTHKHFFGVHSFDYFIRESSHGAFAYSTAQFELVSVEFDKGIQHNHFIDSLVNYVANRNKDFYENRLANIFPLRELTFELKVLK